MEKSRRLSGFGMYKFRVLVTLTIVAFAMLRTPAMGVEPQQYMVKKVVCPMKTDARWNKKEWRGIPRIDLSYLMGNSPLFTPVVMAKMAYDADNFYIIFRVRDRFVRSVVTQTNGPIWEDSCVEIFFAADQKFPYRYYNLEINCGGTALMRYNEAARTKFRKFDPSDVERIEIAHSLPEVVDPEIKDRVEWVIECRIPIAVLQKYANVTWPAKGVEWRANLYKTAAETGSNPHYLTWSEVESDKADFHLPEFFGILKFE